MLIDCDECAMQHTSACDECIVTVLLADQYRRRLEIDNAEVIALDNLADAGMVPHLRLLKKAGNE
jgi:hypothetical protein